MGAVWLFVDLIEASLGWQLWMVTAKGRLSGR